MTVETKSTLLHRNAKYQSAQKRERGDVAVWNGREIKGENGYDDS
jgi:hypothetical protein